jgi:hypothetical protein
MKTFEDRVNECKRLMAVKDTIPTFTNARINQHHAILSQIRVIGNELSLASIHDIVIEDELSPFEYKSMREACTWLSRGQVRRDGKTYKSLAELWVARNRSKNGTRDNA